ncbi:putative Retrotransposon protein, Ty3-gypsy subclass [Hibiscus syriacus]|uniref:Retrotransposon protein, Ty3-gypsy subclass n=1 Tax=Hibiscus syriacus TaxID=106335 RepID=A0A6A2XQ99_HIBSY|nr:putative Retrotransposon protein, Ty3-gypsy subclass [Hibiscus syriacus]
MELDLLLCLLSLLVSADSNGWLSHGGDILNRRYADDESKISPETVSNLRLKWKFNAGRDITATPSVFDGAIRFRSGHFQFGLMSVQVKTVQIKFRSDVYRIRIEFRSGAGRVQIYNFQVQLGFSFTSRISFLQPSWDGYLYAVNKSDGSLIWKQNLQQLTGFNSGGLISNISVIISRTTPAITDDLVIVGICGPASIVAVKRSSGELVWSTLLDGNPAGCITMNFYVVTSSLEEVFSLDKCCTFRGSFVKLDAKTGKIMWQTFMLPDNFGNRGEYAGAAIWGSSPPIDTKRSLVYIATGNLYSFPQNISDCQERQNNQTQVPPTHSDECIESDNHSESFVALDMDTGNIKWFHQLGGYDVSDPKLTWYKNSMIKLAIVQEAGPGGVAGGGTWGAATDEKRVNTNIANSDRKNFTLKPSTRNATAGGWVAVDSNNGRILWSTGDPSNGTISGPVTVANEVLFGGLTYKEGPIYAMDGKTGEIPRSYNTGATVFWWDVS